MDSIICNEEGCENIIHPSEMTYGKDYWVLINLIDASSKMTSKEILCKNCGIIRMAEAQANGFMVVSRR